jgi:aconitase A
MPLYLVQDSDRPMHVIAPSWQSAIDAWKAFVGDENDVSREEMDEPNGVALIAEDTDVLFEGQSQHPSKLELVTVLKDLVDVIETDELIPGSVSYMQRAKEVLKKAIG